MKEYQKNIESEVCNSDKNVVSRQVYQKVEDMSLLILKVLWQLLIKMINSILSSLIKQEFCGGYKRIQ